MFLLIHSLKDFNENAVYFTKYKSCNTSAVKGNNEPEPCSLAEVACVRISFARKGSFTLMIQVPATKWAYF